MIFINPPYAEAGNTKQRAGTGYNKDNVSLGNKTYETYKEVMGRANNELFAQFFIRIYKEIPNCILGSFSTLKYVNATNFIKFREIFKAKFLKGFICPAYTFDNVKGQFPIGFLVWNLGDKKEIKKIKVDIFNESNKIIGKKSFYANDENNIGKWIAKFREKNPSLPLGMMNSGRTDFQNQNLVYIRHEIADTAHALTLTLTNLIACCIFFAVRHAIKASWINDRDQFLHPNDKWQKDTEFQSDCLAFTLFHGQNKISCHIERSEISQQKNNRDTSAFSKPQHDKNSESINHFIPFSEKEVNAKEAFASHFMHDFINGKCANDSTHPLSHISAIEGESHSSLRASKASVTIQKQPCRPASSCHTEGAARSISNLESRDISLDAQYDNKTLDSSVATQPKNDREKEIQNDKTLSDKLFKTESPQEFIPDRPLAFSEQAQAVFSVGLELWRYYHKVASDKTSPQSLANPYAPYNANASLYDIKEFFKGRKPNNNANADTKSEKKGKLNTTSKDLHFNALMATLNNALQNLAKKLESKIYENGFLEE